MSLSVFQENLSMAWCTRIAQLCEWWFACNAINMQVKAKTRMAQPKQRKKEKRVSVNHWRREEKKKKKQIWRLSRCFVADDSPSLCVVFMASFLLHKGRMEGIGGDPKGGRKRDWQRRRKRSWCSQSNGEKVKERKRARETAYAWTDLLTDKRSTVGVPVSPTVLSHLIIVGSAPKKIHRPSFLTVISITHLEIKKWNTAYTWNHL